MLYSLTTSFMFFQLFISSTICFLNSSLYLLFVLDMINLQINLIYFIMSEYFLSKLV